MLYGEVAVFSLWAAEERKKIYIATYLWNIGWYQTMLFKQPVTKPLKSLAQKVDSVRSTIRTIISWVYNQTVIFDSFVNPRAFRDVNVVDSLFVRPQQLAIKMQWTATAHKRM